MLSNYTNDIAIYQKCIGINERGEKIFDKPFKLSCKKQGNDNIILNKDNSKNQTIYKYFTMYKATVGDRIDNMVILKVKTMQNLSSDIVGYVVSV